MDAQQTGMRLKAWRLSKQWSQSTLGEEIGTSKFQISRWEHGRYRMNRMAQTALKRLGFE